MERYTVMIDELYITKELETDNLYQAYKLYHELRDAGCNALIWDNVEHRSLTD